MNEIKTALCYDDVLLVPQYSMVKSRKDVDLSSNLGRNINLSIPIIASPMSTICEIEMALAMSRVGGLGIVHRYMTLERQVDIIKKLNEHNVLTAFAVGVTGDYLKRIEVLEQYNVDIICLDVAHGDSILMEQAIFEIKNRFNDRFHLMVGNVATEDAFEGLCQAGANSIRVGVSPGSICSTSVQTGHGLPTFQSIVDCCSISKQYGVPIIADGGCKNSGDVVKALGAGGSFVMLGSMLAGTDQCPGDILAHNNRLCKVYSGMGSKTAQISYKGEFSSDEGISTYVDYKGCVEDVIEDICRGVRSGLSYSGAFNIKELQHKADFMKRTAMGQKESRPHILEKA